MKTASLTANDPADGFLDLARLIWNSGPAAPPTQPNDSDPSIHTGVLVAWLASLLRHANSGIGGIHLGRNLTPALVAAFRTHPEFFHLENNTLQLPRYARHRELIRDFFSRRHCAPRSLLFANDNVAAALDAIFPAQQLLGADGSSVAFDNAQQRLAIANLVDAPVGVLTGGPGTGKTTTAAALLALRKRLDPTLHPESVLVAAPTGKSACRIGEAIRKATAHLVGLSTEEQTFLHSIRAITLHKALEWSPIPPERGGPFRRNAGRPLEARIVLVDEASMVDLALMHALIEALPEHTCLLLLGDSDQLESVEVGGMLAELVHRASQPELPGDLLERLSQRLRCDGAKVTGNFRSGLKNCPAGVLPPLTGLMIGLKYSRRAMHAPWILDLAALFRPEAVSSLQDVRALFGKHQGGNLVWHAERPGRSRKEMCRERFQAWEQQTLGWTNLAQEKTGAALSEPLRELLKFQLLCSSNVQVEVANTEGVAWLTGHEKQIHTALPHGCPIIVETNDHALGLSNGDVGIILGATAKQPGTMALFASGTDSPRLIPVAQLPAHRAAFALTIHKSQGSEWDHVAIELPWECGSSLLSRNLLYTAITRSSRRIDLFGTASVLQELTAPETTADADA